MKQKMAKNPIFENFPNILRWALDGTYVDDMLGSFCFWFFATDRNFSKNFAREHTNAPII